MTACRAAGTHPRKPPGLLTAILLALLWTAPALAEHEADHRYVVEGYVLDARENPRADVKVLVKAEEGLLGEAVTDRRGFYRIQLHLHNTDLGKELTVTAGDQETEIEVAFDPGDKQTARIHHLNFTGADTTQADMGSRGFPTWAYVVIGIIILLLLARTISRALKQRRKAQARQEQKQYRKKRKKKAKRKPHGKRK